MTASETKTCAQCQSSFTIEAEDFLFYEKMKVPPPTFCSQCRLKRRLLWRNERVLFRRNDDASGKEIFSGFPKDVPFPVYERDYWWSDSWDAMDYGRNFDPSRPFLEQLYELMKVVPQASRAVTKMVNSDYTDQSGSLKNCYLSFNSEQCEDSLYLVRGILCKETNDALHTQSSEVIYDSVMLEKCFRCFYSLDCEASTDLWFSNDCVGCTNCFGCVGLRKKNYCIYNEQYSKEEYYEKLKSFNLGSRSSIKKLRHDVAAFWRKFPSRYYHGIRNVGSTGDMLSDTKNVRQSWWVIQAQDIRYSQGIYSHTSDCYDFTTWGYGASRVYESLTCGEQINDIKFCFDCWPACKNLDYCITCHSTSDSFGCIGLKKQQYCILNKQYSKEDYLSLKQTIIKQMNDMPYVSKNTTTGVATTYRYGEFFPLEFSPFAYNETMLQDCFPLTKEQATAQGYAWRETASSTFVTTIKGDALSDAITDVTDAVLKEIIECTTCHKAYRIISQELTFYRKIGAPLPDQCPDCRHATRFAFVNPPRSTVSKCNCAGVSDDKGTYTNPMNHFHSSGHCPNSFETCYPNDAERSLYCEQCYNTEIL